VTCRKIEGLREVIKLPRSPWPPTKLTGFAKQGKAFEKAIAKALPSAIHNPWFQFRDLRGLGCCSPDILLPTSQGILCIEVKLTYTDEAQRQLTYLYLPILQSFFGVPAAGLVIVKSLGQGFAGPTPHRLLSSALAAPPSGQWPLLLCPLASPAHLRAQLTIAP
jgi:hypothetical protein